MRIGKMLNTLVVRADADSRMGTGHLMRCFTLAQGWQTRGGRIIFATNCNNDRLTRHFEAANMPIAAIEHPHPNPMDWDRTSKMLNSNPGAWLVLDGYHFDSAYQRRIKDGGHRLFVIDDTAHLDRYYGDIVLNQNLKAEHMDYSAQPFTRFLLGPRYALLRQEFLSRRYINSNIPRIASKVLVTLGGGDDQNQTLRVIRALQAMALEGLEAVVVVGAANPHRSALESEANKSKFLIQLTYNAGNMPELMEWADLAVCAGGTTCWELAFMGVPTLVIILAANQQANAEGLEEEGVSVNLGWYSRLSREKIEQKLIEIAYSENIRAQMSRRGRFLVDGKGIERVLRELTVK